MGKAALFLVVAAMISGGALLRQVDLTEVETDTRQAARQGQVLAREIARSGQNVVLAQARKLQRTHPNMKLEQIVSQINGNKGYTEGAYQGGTFQAKLSLTSSSSFAVESLGAYKIREHEVNTERDAFIEVTIVDEDILAEEVLEVDTPSELDVTFLESMAGYCSAIYLQRWIPKNNNGHGNNVDGCDVSNPGNNDCIDSDPTVDDEIHTGKGKLRFTALEPELIFAPGNNRDGATAHFSTTLNPGERMNFILAVDADFNCEQRDNDVPWNHSTYEYTRDALLESVSGLSDLQEAPYAMIQAKPGEPGTWRVAFEDLYFSGDKLDDVKKNSYGGSWSNSKKTYGGSGWLEYGSHGYWKLRDYGDRPDFSDQVIEVTLVTPTIPPAL